MNWTPITSSRKFTVCSADSTGGVFGDVDRNGRLNASDVQLVINAALNLTVPFDCDLSEDGFVDAVDVQLVIAAVLDIPIQ